MIFEQPLTMILSSPCVQCLSLTEISQIAGAFNKFSLRSFSLTRHK